MNTKLQSSTSWLARAFLFTARTSLMSMPCFLACLKMQFWTYFWRFRQCQLNFMPFASDLHAAVAFSRATLSALDSFAASGGGRHECNAANRDGGNGNPNQVAFQVFHLCSLPKRRLRGCEEGDQHKAELKAAMMICIIVGSP